jgi:hypothetical protein
MRSPACALTLFGEKTSVPLGPPTWMMCVLTMPAAALDPDCDAEPVDMLAFADATEDCAAAKPKRADTMTDVEKCMLTVVCGCSFRKRGWIDY